MAHILGTAAFKNTAVFGATNTGNGTISNLDATFNAKSEKWYLKCIVAGTPTSGAQFEVIGTISGLQTNILITGIPYANDDDSLHILIADGDVEWSDGSGSNPADELTVDIIRDIRIKSYNMAPTDVQLVLTGDVTDIRYTLLGGIEGDPTYPVNTYTGSVEAISNGGCLYHINDRILTRSLSMKFTDFVVTTEGTATVYVQENSSSNSSNVTTACKTNA